MRKKDLLTLPFSVFIENGKSSKAARSEDKKQIRIRSNKVKLARVIVVGKYHKNKLNIE